MRPLLRAPRTRPRTARLLALVALVAAAWWVAGPSTLGGPASYVTTRGDSMAPSYRSGDLVVVRSRSDYRVGDVVAYRSDVLDSVVLHRVVDATAGSFGLQGDANTFVDPERPTADQLLGAQLVHVPRAGVVLGHLTGPVALGAYTFLFMTGAGTAATRRHRRRPRSTTMSSSRPAVTDSLATLVRPVQVAATGTAVLALLALLLTAVSWSAPSQETVNVDSSTDRRMTFTYTAPVARSAAYDGTTVTSPAPVFRRLTESVDVGYRYDGPPGTVTLSAVVSTVDGWSTTVRLRPPTPVVAGGHEGSTRLDLAAVQDRADAAAAATGLPGGPVTVRIAPSVVGDDGAVFAPVLELRLDPLVLSLPGGPDSLSVVESAAGSSSEVVPGTLSVAGADVTVDAARRLGGVLLLASVLAVAVVAVAARRTRPRDEAEGLRRRWASRLVEVRDAPPTTGRTCVDVTGPAALARVADRSGLPILHGSGPDGDAFLVHDDTVSYRYLVAHAP